MQRKILVTYASRAGSTQAVAQAIGETLTLAGAKVDVLSVREAIDLAPYQAVVAGSAIQGGKWLPEAMRFVEMNQSTLALRPFAAFLVCMSLATSDGEDRLRVASWLAPVRARVRPVSEGLFAGALNIRRARPAGTRHKTHPSLFIGAWPEGDYRDWGAINLWAQRLYPLLMPRPTVIPDIFAPPPVVRERSFV